MISKICSRGTLRAIVEGITALQTSADPCLLGGAARLARDYAGSAWLVHCVLRRTSRRPLEQIFRVAYGVALRSIAYGRFLERLRAMIVAKDRAPGWNRSIDEIDAAWVNETDLALLPAAGNPLFDLGPKGWQRMTTCSGNNDLTNVCDSSGPGHRCVKLREY